jgi:hypothetical protein
VSKFEGFDLPNTTPVPDIVFDELLSELTGNELKVLLYIIRRTYGFGKNADAISLSQFREGITTKDEKVLDKGCGIEHNRTILVALNSLEAKGYITSKKGKTSQGDKATTIYRLHFKDSPEANGDDRVVTSSNYGSLPQVTTVVTSDNDRSYPTSRRVVTPGNIQETVIQDTDSQETVKQENIATANADRNAPITDLQQWKTDSGKMKAITKGSAISGSDSTRATTQDSLAQTPASSSSSQDGAQRTDSSPTGTAPASSGAARASRHKNVEAPTPKCDTKEIQRRINEHRGYALEEKIEVIRERQAIKSWCALHTIEEYEATMEYVRHDPYWRKTENLYRFGGVNLAKMTPIALSKKPLALVANGNMPPPEQDGPATLNGLVWWDGKWQTETEADKTGFNGGFGWYK